MLLEEHGELVYHGQVATTLEKKMFHQPEIQELQLHLAGESHELKELMKKFKNYWTVTKSQKV